MEQINLYAVLIDHLEALIVMFLTGGAAWFLRRIERIQNDTVRVVLEDSWSIADAAVQRMWSAVGPDVRQALMDDGRIDDAEWAKIMATGKEAFLTLIGTEGQKVAKRTVGDVSAWADAQVEAAIARFLARNRGPAGAAL